MDGATCDLVRGRAGFCCEYCRLAQKYSELSHHIEHIVARQHGGSDRIDNLALACHRCNLHKGPNLTGIDPQSGQVASLFHPRREIWEEHFSFDGEWIIGLTTTGRPNRSTSGDERPAPERTEARISEKREVRLELAVSAQIDYRQLLRQGWLGNIRDSLSAWTQAKRER